MYLSLFSNKELFNLVFNVRCILKVHFGFCKNLEHAACKLEHMILFWTLATFKNLFVEFFVHYLLF